MTWAPGPVVTRRRLGGELKQLRERSGLKLEDVARRLECSPSKISRLENGKGIPRARDVRDMLDAYGVTDSEVRRRLDEWARTGQAKMWWQDYADVLPGGLARYVELEWDALRICAYESHLVHGLLQTPDYARAVLRGAWSATRTPSQIERMVEVRQKRQRILGAEHGLTLRCVLDESALYRMVSSPDVLRRQLEHLIDVARSEHVDVRVLPFAAGPVAAFVESFAKLEFAEGLGDGLIHVEHLEGPAFQEEPEDVATYEGRLSELLKVALPEDDSVALIHDAVRRLTT